MLWHKAHACIDVLNGTAGLSFGCQSILPIFFNARTGSVAARMGIESARENSRNSSCVVSMRRRKNSAYFPTGRMLVSEFPQTRHVIFYLPCCCLLIKSPHTAVSTRNFSYARTERASQARKCSMSRMEDGPFQGFLNGQSLLDSSYAWSCLHLALGYCATKNVRCGIEHLKMRPGGAHMSGRIRNRPVPRLGEARMTSNRLSRRATGCRTGE